MQSAQANALDLPDGVDPPLRSNQSGRYYHQG